MTQIQVRKPYMHIIVRSRLRKKKIVKKTVLLSAVFFSGCIPQKATLHASTPCTPYPVPPIGATAFLGNSTSLPIGVRCVRSARGWGMQRCLLGMQPEEKHCISTNSRAFCRFFCVIASAQLALSNRVGVSRVYKPEFESSFAFSVKQAKNGPKRQETENLRSLRVSKLKF